MKSLPVRWSKTGRQDINTLIDDIVEASGSTTVALGYTDRIETRCEKIGSAPHGGTPRDDLKPGLRTVPFERSALICYVVEADAVWITNVFRRGRDVAAYFGDRVDD